MKCNLMVNTYVVFDVDIAGRPFWIHSVLTEVLPVTDAAIHSYLLRMVVAPHIVALVHWNIRNGNVVLDFTIYFEIGSEYSNWIRWIATYIWSALVCSSAAVSWRVSASSFIDSKWFASSATRGWKSNDFFDGDPTDDSDIGSSLSTEISNQFS